MSGAARPRSSVVLEFPVPRQTESPACERVLSLEDLAMGSSDYRPVACNDAVAMWILDQVKRAGSLDIDLAVGKIGTLFGTRFTVEVAPGGWAVRKSVHLAVRDLSNGAVSYNRRERAFRRK